MAPFFRLHMKTEFIPQQMMVNFWWILSEQLTPCTQWFSSLLRSIIATSSVKTFDVFEGNEGSSQSSDRPNPPCWSILKDFCAPFLHTSFPWSTSFTVSRTSENIWKCIQWYWGRYTFLSSPGFPSYSGECHRRSAWVTSGLSIGGHSHERICLAQPTIPRARLLNTTGTLAFSFYR